MTPILFGVGESALVMAVERSEAVLLVMLEYPTIKVLVDVVVVAVVGPTNVSKVLDVAIVYLFAMCLSGMLDFRKTKDVGRCVVSEAGRLKLIIPETPARSCIPLYLYASV